MGNGHPKARRCSARSKTTGKTCTRPAIRGGMVCRYHGGAAPQVQAKARERLADLIDPDRVLREAARLAFSDIRELFDEGGNLKPVTDWPEHLAAAVASVEVMKRNLGAGDGKQEDVVKVRVWDKPKNIELLMKHLGLLKEQVAHTGEIAIRWQE